ncbi:unnamed protein product [Brassicogethes aeneus]|uniref:Uncharacterized protein n=1 Tax=Brassicogethes aeneus TaxID=1431903 RepID=A0A9P0FLH0_BRAAE|nr:unnamed protein product [Brassicogethes aeneus]
MKTTISIFVSILLVLLVKNNKSLEIFKCNNTCIKTDTHPEYYVVDPKVRHLNSSFFNSGNILVVIARGGKLSNLNTGTFSKLNGLRRLYLDGNEIKYINYGSLNNLFMQHLDLGLNQIVDVETEALSKLINLQSLYLHGNKLTTFEFSWFTANNVKSPLKVIYLNNNNIQTLQRNTFYIFPNITHIYLQFNQIGYIGDNTFNSNDKLEVIDLSFNHLSNISPFIFQNTPAVGKFLIAFNSISYINRDLFRTTHIKSVSLHPNLWICSCYHDFIKAQVNTTYYHHYKYPYLKTNYHEGKDITMCYYELKCNEFKQKETDFFSEKYFNHFMDKIKNIYQEVLSESTQLCDSETVCQKYHVCRNGICWNLYQKFHYNVKNGIFFWKQ